MPRPARLPSSALLASLLLGVVLLADRPAQAEPGDPAVAADDDNGASQTLERSLRVLRTRPNAAGGACLDAMASVRRTEDQLKDEASHRKHSASPDGDPIPDPDLDVTHDVLASDDEAAAQACGIDAQRLCASPAPAPARELPDACAGLGAGRP